MEREIISLFMTYFDGVYDIQPRVKNLNTFILGVCKLSFDENENTLHVYLRRPGLLIGKAGENIKALQEYLDCNVYVHEVRLDGFQNPLYTIDEFEEILQSTLKSTEL